MTAVVALEPSGLRSSTVWGPAAGKAARAVGEKTIVGSKTTSSLGRSVGKSTSSLLKISALPERLEPLSACALGTGIGGSGVDV